MLKKKLDKDGQEMALTILESVSKEHKEKSQEEFQEVLEVIKGFGESKTKLSLDGGSSWMDFKEAADLSMEEIKEKISNQIQKELAPANAFPWVEETHQDYVIVEVNSRDGSESSFYEYEYEVMDDESIQIGEPYEVEKVVTWEPVEEEGGMEAVESKMEIEGKFIPLVESAKKPFIDKNGKTKIKLIEPGWGESAYYPAETLARDCKIFEGAKMYWNHPTPEEEKERPEGDLNNLAGIISGKPKYEESGPKGAGVYAEAEIFENFRNPLEELAPHIGVSIRAGGKAKTGKVDNREGKIAEAITHKKSVDFVTEPGAGGEIIPLFEAAGRGEYDKFKESRKNEEVEKPMKLEKLTLEELKEARTDLVEELKTELGEIEGNEELKEAQRKIGKLEEKLMLREASTFIKDILSEAKLPKKTKTRLFSEALNDTPTNKEGEVDKEKLKESTQELIKEAQEEIKEAMGGAKIKGMGESEDMFGSEKDNDELEAELTESFTKFFNGDEGKGKIAALGR